MCQSQGLHLDSLEDLMSIVFESAIGDLFAPRGQIFRVQVKTLGPSLRWYDLGC